MAKSPYNEDEQVASLERKAWTVLGVDFSLISSYLGSALRIGRDDPTRFSCQAGVVQSHPCHLICAHRDLQITDYNLVPSTDVVLSQLLRHL